MKVANMEDQIKMLIELQELDGEIYNKKRVLDDVPAKMKELDDLLEQKSADVKNLEENSKKLQLEMKEKEVEMGSKEGVIKKYQTQLSQVKTNKEYSTLEKEIATVKADNSLLEEEIINLLDKIESVQKDIKKEKDVLEGETKKIEEQKKKMEEEKKAAQAECDDLNNKRKDFVAKVDRRVLSKYERILHNKDGLAMVPVVDDACGGCNMNLPPQVVNEARLKKDLTFCGNCARILYSTQ